MIYLTSMLLLPLVQPSSLVGADRDHCSVGEIERLMKAHEIIPDLLLSPAAQKLEVFYDDFKIDMGGTLNYVDSLAPPTEFRWDYDKNAYYSLVYTGLDVPSREEPTERESQHWIVGNIPQNNVSAGEIIFPFQPPGMQYAPGNHRMVFVVFKQRDEKPIHFDELDLNLRRTSVNRAYYSTAEFGKKYQFGNALAINFFEFTI